MMYHLASGNAWCSACSPGTPLYLQAASALLTALCSHKEALTKITVLVIVHIRDMMCFEKTGQCCHHLFMACPASSVLTHARRRLLSPLLLSNGCGLCTGCAFVRLMFKLGCMACR
jgi:hypothetical protein